MIIHVLCFRTALHRAIEAKNDAVLNVLLQKAKWVVGQLLYGKIYLEFLIVLSWIIKKLVFLSICLEVLLISISWRN